MRFTKVFTTQLVALSSASPHFARQYETENPHEWIAAGPNDFRGRYPMLNILANHGYLPATAATVVTKPNAVAALTGSINFNASLASLMFDQAIIANAEPNATFFTLDQLNVHNVLEHDASLSRTDAYFDSNHIFNTPRSFWTAPTVTADMLANSKIYRQIESKAFNPDYTFTATAEQFSLGEVAAPVIAFGDMEAFTVFRDLMENFFLNERFPTDLGWSAKEEVVSLGDVQRVAQAIGKVTNLLTGGEDKGAEHGAKVRRGDFHAGMF
ncbi:Cloroperoxidase [Bimuria novae-zelandiae CBS 107.79]|uniref:Cloroperoxidase n=1 Tax=Bimuria novae-zelandiae CBS 107.79 TaxID=1447943 RepID=A0A6A5VYB8_9PLEO|nr:Cloroperoxidase [Bimuria novae-zelandiae CBS 107.79]